MSRKLPSLTPREVSWALERGGFLCDRVRGSHHHYKHPDDPTLLVVVLHHARDIKRGVLRAIIKQANLTVDEFLNLL